MRDRAHWSYSAINQYLRCPLQYFFQRILSLPSHSIGSGLVMGSAVHAGLAEYHRRVKEQEDIDKEAIFKVFHECWGEKEANEKVLFRDGDNRDDSIGQGISLLEIYFREPPPEKIVAIEQRFLVPLCNSQGEYLETPLVELLSNVVDEVVSQAATLGRMTPSWNLVSLATSTRCFAASRVRQW